MSRLAPHKASPTIKRQQPPPGGADDDKCPVCKSTRYLNTNLRLLLNPECYHKMCDSCVDRIFSHGPAQCPIPGCRKTLRKAKFRQQTFEDVQVEREVDIRKKVAAVFNKREDEFETLRDWNDYLNEVEDITFNLIHSIDVEETEKRFALYRQAHEAEILENASLAEQERLAYSQQKKADRELAKERREAARREDAEERREAEANRKDVLSRLAAGQDADAVARHGEQVTLKKRMDRAAAAERQRHLHSLDARNGSANSNLIKGLRAKVKAEPEAPIDPFGGIAFASRYFVLQDDYVWAGVQETKGDPLVSVSGYDVTDFTGRALWEAFAGLGVFVAEKDGLRVDEAEADVGTVKAELAGKEVVMEGKVV